MFANINTCSHWCKNFNYDKFSSCVTDLHRGYGNLYHIGKQLLQVHFERRIKLLNQLVASWKENEDVALVNVNTVRNTYNIMVDYLLGG
jgi:hypothetical protein